MTNAQKLMADTDRIVEALYKSDDFEDICQMVPDEEGEFPSVRPECDKPRGCVVCIREWLEKEVSDGKDK